MTGCNEVARVDRHFEGTLPPDSERAMRDHLPGCPTCHARYQRWLLLARLDPGVLPAEERIARGLGLRRGAVVVRPFGVAAAATLVAAAAALLFWVRSASELPGFTARGGTPRSSVSRVFVYDVRPGRPAALASDSIARGDELAFAYENGAARDRLMIFGVDEHRHVYWFYPAWVSAAESPIAIPIEHDSLRHELPEAVKHAFDGAHIEVRSLFVDAPVTVTQVEAMLRDNPAGPLPIPGAVETAASFAVDP
jgi:hypothetical protein